MLHACEMAPTQRRLYEKVRDTWREKVFKSIDDKGVEHSQIAILDDVSLRGRACLPGDGLVQIGPLAEGEAGSHSFTVQATGQATTYLTCPWDGRADSSARVAVTFGR
jgi:hypothetical protein